MGNANIEALAKGMDPEALQALINALSGNADTPAEPSENPEGTRADQFRSLGFVAQGTSTPTPSEGDIIDVPTKAGKLNRVQLIEQVDPSEYVDTVDGTWYFTYRKLKRGE